MGKPRSECDRPRGERHAGGATGSGRAGLYAHTLPNRPERDWEPLEEHLRAVAERAAAFGEAFGAADWGRVAGLWHDLGKYSAAFQRYLEVSSARGSADDAAAETLPGRVDHSTAGARHAAARDLVAGRLLAYVIAGHHAGLSDRGPPDQAGTLEARLVKIDPVITDALTRAPRDVLDQAVPARPPLRMNSDPTAAGFQLAFFTRMLFAALVDADYLSTEAFVDRGRSNGRSRAGELAPLVAAIRREIKAKASSGAGVPRAAHVAKCRAAVAADCAAAAERTPGFFTLTVPTGGGKTLSSMLFALEHARRHNLRRVIVAVPFTSIIDQNAAVYRQVLGDQNVLEHHSNLDPDRETPWRRLTSENWDAPVVVTTTVQLFESLFAARPAACRKLHNIARGVIILDEAQALPVTLLRPVLAALRELVAHYGCTVVLCTATQPALGERPGFPIGLPLGPGCEIVRDVPALFGRLRRTRVRAVGSLDDVAVAKRLLASPAALAIVNTRRHAAALYTRVREVDPHPSGDRGPLHLSALMCPAHRRVVLDEVRRRLTAGEPCRLVSTQVIEAGVDVDFPAVLRSMTGLDSIAQSAGRCNREGRLGVGEVEVFTPDAESEGRVPSSIGHARDAAAQVLPDHADDPLATAAVEAFFRQHYWKQSDRWDARKVMECFNVSPGPRDGPPVLDLSFKTAAERFVMIDESQRGVVVPYGREGPRLIAALMRGDPPTRELWARLQRHSVNVPRHTLDRLLAVGVISESEGGVAFLADATAYDADLGLLTDRDAMSPELLCC